MSCGLLIVLKLLASVPRKNTLDTGGTVNSQTVNPFCFGEGSKPVNNYFTTVSRWVGD